MIDTSQYIHRFQKQVCFLQARQLLPYILTIFLFSWPTSFVQAEHFVWFGSYTGKPPRGQGIYVARFDENTGDISKRELACKVKNPSFLAIHPTLAHSLRGVRNRRPEWPTNGRHYQFHD